MESNEKVPVDVLIYISNFKTDLVNGPEYKQILNEFDISDSDKFTDLLFSTAEVFSCRNFEADGAPELTHDQFEKCVISAAVECHLNTLTENGYIKSTFTADGTEVFSATDKGINQSLISNICLN